VIRSAPIGLALCWSVYHGADYLIPVRRVRLSRRRPRLSSSPVRSPRPLHYAGYLCAIRSGGLAKTAPVRSRTAADWTRGPLSPNSANGCAWDGIYQITSPLSPAGLTPDAPLIVDASTCPPGQGPVEDTQALANCPAPTRRSLGVARCQACVPGPCHLTPLAAPASPQPRPDRRHGAKQLTVFAPQHGVDFPRCSRRPATSRPRPLHQRTSRRGASGRDNHQR
jgi:hypothetical protein